MKTTSPSVAVQVLSQVFLAPFGLTHLELKVHMAPPRSWAGIPESKSVTLDLEKLLFVDSEGIALLRELSAKNVSQL